MMRVKDPTLRSFAILGWQSKEGVFAVTVKIDCRGESGSFQHRDPVHLR
jgi:hypothetical protein